MKAYFKIKSLSDPKVSSNGRSFFTVEVEPLTEVVQIPGGGTAFVEKRVAIGSGDNRRDTLSPAYDESYRELIAKCSHIECEVF